MHSHKGGREEPKEADPIGELDPGAAPVVARGVVQAHGHLDNGVVKETQRIGSAEPYPLQSLMALPEAPGVELLYGLEELGRRFIRHLLEEG